MGMGYSVRGDKMKCENYLCIYENQGECLLENVALNILGQCKECIYIDIEQERLNRLKEKTRVRLE